MAPELLPFSFGDESVNSGEVASLMCTVHKGDFPVKIIWLHNNKTVDQNHGILISRTGKKVSTLTIESVDAFHSGIYTCIAKNKAGSTSFSTELLVNGIRL